MRGYVPLRRGLLEHLPAFAKFPDALVVYLWALLSRDYRTGEICTDRRDIASQTGLSQWRIKRAIHYLAHGRGCDCRACAELSPWDRPQYLRTVVQASRGAPPVYFVCKDESARRVNLPKGSPDAPALPFPDERERRAC